MYVWGKRRRIKGTIGRHKKRNKTVFHFMEESYSQYITAKVLNISIFLLKGLNGNSNTDLFDNNFNVIF